MKGVRQLLDGVFLFSIIVLIGALLPYANMGIFAMAICSVFIILLAVVAAKSILDYIGPVEEKDHFEYTTEGCSKAIKFLKEKYPTKISKYDDGYNLVKKANDLYRKL